MVENISGSEDENGLKDVGDEEHVGDEAVAVQNVRGSEDRNGLKDVGDEEHVEDD